MVTLKPIVIDPMSVSNAVYNTAKIAAKRARPWQQHVHYVEAITPQTTKAVTIIKNINTLSTPTTDLLSHNAVHHTSPHNNQQSPDLKVDPMLRHYMVKDQHQLSPTWKSPCP